MAYEEKTDWLPDDPINEDDVNRWEKGIKDAHTDLAAHKNDMNNPHNTTKAQVGLGNVDNVQQAAKKDFDKHEQDQVRHITEEEREKWNGAQLSKITKDDGQPMFNITSDFHTELMDYPSFTYFSYTGTPLNSPGGSGRGFWTCSDSKLYGHVLVMTNDNRTFRKTLLNGNWSDWFELETTEGAQTKVNAHAGNSDIHVTQSDKDKWNNSQIFKVTADNGQGKLYLSETDDFHEIVPKNTGMVHFTSASNTVNGPGTSVRGIWTINATGNYGQIIGFDNANKTYRKTIAGGNWSDWVELETTAGTQTKVNAHADNSDIHVAQAEKDKWNNSQLFKVTADNGQGKLYLSETDDFHEIVPQNTGMVHFTSASNTANGPGTSVRGIWTINATGNYGQIIAFDNANKTYRKTIAGGNWSDWVELETTAGAQSKADKSLTDAKNYVDTNYTNQKLTILTGSNAIQDARTGGDAYPSGITLMVIDQENTTGYPGKLGLVRNEKYNNYRFTQYFYNNGNFSYSYSGTGSWIRQWYNQSGWTEWEKISGFAHVIAGTDGKQELKKGEQNKIYFKNTVKDSHNLYDSQNSRFVASHPGMYLINASIFVDNKLQYSNFELYAYVNGTQYKLINQYRITSPKDNNDTNEFNATVTGSVTVPLNAGDYVEIYVYVGYTGTAARYIADKPITFNYFDILELGGRNY
ncbi:terminase [Bacillus vallismortis]|uniref:terminase n=1 Tax=Bacillus vallismortis TaxID=72361 RepID=UPI003B97D68A